ncbi:molybdate ABC transporter permease subunit [Azotosporobacter soli]|uniref:molybdate ABC transporter permease subunit n=1 Tax=Azotosporobacter soli TaxID=3055040 RepID=UPI0031FED48F
MFDWFPVLLSLKVAAVSLVIVFFLGVASAFVMHRWHFPGQSILEALFMLPLVLPPVVTGFLLLLLIGKQGPLGYWLHSCFDLQLIFTVYAAILAGVVVAFPLMYQSTKAAFSRVDHRLEDAARTLGASEWRVFFTITLPLAKGGLLSGMVLSFARALGEFGATIMVAGNIPGRTQTLPLAIYFAAEANDLSKAGAYVLLISALTFLLIFGLNRWNKPTGRRASEQGWF